MSKVSKKIFISCLIAILIFSFGIGLKLSNTFAVENDITSLDIQLDLGSYNKDELPNGVENCSYPVFGYNATDNLGNKISDVEVLVYYDAEGDSYTGNLSDDVLVATENGRFKTENAGEYVIEYTARYQALRKTIRLYVTVVEEELYVESDYQINSGIVSESFTGYEIKLLEGEIISDDKFGVAELAVDVSYSGDYAEQVEKVDIIKGVDSSDYFCPIVAGEYKITYTVTNILGKDKAVPVTKVITVTDNVKPILSVPSLNRVMFKGKTVELPVAQAVQYYNGRQIFVPVTVLFNGNNVTETRLVTPETEGKATITYVAKSVVDSQIESRCDIDVMVHDLTSDNGDIFLSKYLYLDGFSGKYYKKNEVDNGVKYSSAIYTLTADGTVNQATMYFGRAIHTGYLSAEFEAEQSLASFGNLYLYFVDSVDSSKVVELKLHEVLTSSKPYVEVYLNGNFVKKWENKCFGPFENGSSLTGSSVRKFSVKYDYKTQTLVDVKGNLICEVTSYANGRAFDGFSSGKAYLSLKLDEINGLSQIKLVNLCTQSFSNMPKDRTKPNVFTPKSRLFADINTVVTLKNLEIFDILDDDLRLKLNVTSPSGKTVVDEYITDDYQITVDEYGKYQVKYTAYDSSGNYEDSYATQIEVVDRIAPTLSVTNVPANVKKGETVSLPTPNATDNFDDEPTTWIMVSYGNFRNEYVTDGKYRFNETGTYYVKYKAVDSTGNYCIITYTVVCE